MFGLISFDPIVELVLGPVRISPHGLGTALGFLAGARLFLPRTRRLGVPDATVMSMLHRGALGALVGARLAYVANHPGDFDGILDVLAVWEGGISLLGGLAGGIIAASTVVRRERLPFWPLLDAAVPGMALGIAIGRIGDLVVGDHLGKPTSLPIGYRCGTADTASPCVAPVGEGVHLPALYDLVSVSLLFGVLLVLRRREHWAGYLAAVFALWYGTGRFVEDWFRIDETHGTALTGSQWAALAMITAGTWLLLRRRTPRWPQWHTRPTTSATSPPAPSTTLRPPAPATGRPSPRSEGEHPTMKTREP